MKVRVLGCSGAIAKGCRTTSFLVDESILIDAGTGVGDLTLDEMHRIDHVFLTHSHLDHIAALPLMLDAVSGLRTSPLQVHGLPATLAALQAHVFNNTIWPDFSAIPSPATPFMQYKPLQTGDIITLEGNTIEVLPAAHSVPAVGYAVQGDTGWWVFSGDTARNPAFWARINQMPVAALIIETAFSNCEQALAERSQHLSPHTLAQELAHIAPGRRHLIYITHTKPSETDLIMHEITQQQATATHSALHDIKWLAAGMVLDI